MRKIDLSLNEVYFWISVIKDWKHLLTEDESDGHRDFYKIKNLFLFISINSTFFKMGGKGKKISINKYLLFYFFAIVVLSFTVIPKIWYCIKYKGTIGTIQYFEPVSVPTFFGQEIQQRPRVDFAINNKTYSFLGNNFLRDANFGGDTVKIIYDPTSPHKAYINSWLGIWAPEFANVIPILFITFLCFGLEYIPNRIAVRF